MATIIYVKPENSPVTDLTLKADEEMIIASGGTASKTTIEAQASATVNHGGSANSTTIQEGGVFLVNGGKAVGVTVASGGNLETTKGSIVTDIVADKGAILALTVAPDTQAAGKSNGVAFQIENGSATGFALEDGTLSVSSGGTAIQAILNTGGTLDVYHGGKAVSATVNANGELIVHSGGTATETTVNAGGRLVVHSCGLAETAVVAQGANLEVISSGGLATWAKVSGQLTVSDGGKATGATVFAGAVLKVATGGIAEGADVDGFLDVLNGGLASNITLKKGASGSIQSHGIGSDIAVEDGATLEVLSAGKLKGATVYKGGTATIHADVTASNVVIDGGKVTVMSDGRAEQTGVSGNTIVENGGLLEIQGGAHVVGAYVSDGGHVDVQSDGSFASALITGADVSAYKGAIVSHVDLKNGGTLRIESGASVKHLNVSEGGILTGILHEVSEIRFYGGTVDLDISKAAPGNDFIIDDYSFSNFKTTEVDTYLCTLTVAGTQANGAYKLIEAAGGFDKTITVQDTTGKSLGTISVGGGETTIGTKKYALAIDAAGLNLTIAAAASLDTTPPTVTGITPSTTEPAESVTVTAVFTDDVAVASSLYKLGETGEWTAYPDGGVTMTENGTVFFKAVDTSGNESAVVSYEVANIVEPGNEPDNKPDSGWNDYLYDKKKGWNKVENIDKFASNVITGNGEIHLDLPGTIDLEGMHNMFGNDGTDVDTGDVGKISVTTAAKVSFSVKTSADGTFYIYEDGLDKKGNRKQIEVGKVTVKNGKVATLSNICLTSDGQYYAQMTAKNVKKTGTKGIYNVTVVDSTIFRDADDGWNNAATNKAVVENPFHLERNVKTIKLDNTDMIDGGDYNNFVGFSDPVDYAKIELASTAYLSFDIAANGNAKFTLWKRDTGSGKFSKVGSPATLKTKNGAQVTKSTKAQLLQVSDKYEYFISMESTDANKGNATYYNVNVNTVATRFFDSADGGENNWLFDKKNKAYNDDANLRSNTISKSGDNVVILDNNEIGDNAFENFVGYQDSADYAKIVLTQNGTLTFKITALADVTFEIWQKGTDKKGKNVLNSLQKKTSLKVKDYAVGATVTTAALTLDAGEYYVSVTAKSSKASEKGSAFYNVTAMFSPSASASDSLAMPEADSLAMSDSLSCGRSDLDLLADISADFSAQKVFGESGSGMLASL